MFDQATATADPRHRAFFGREGEVRQVWARRGDGTLFYLADGAVDDEVRAAAHDGQLICPYPGCPDPRFIAKGGSERRHHFAHQVAGQEHRSTAVWCHQALLMLTDWLTGRYPHLEITLDDNEDGAALSIRSPRSGRVLRLTVTYDRRYQPAPPAPGEQVLVGHSRALLLPRQEAQDAPGCWWCGKGRLVGDIVADRGWVIAINPQERLIATVTTSDLARSAQLTQDRNRTPLLCVVDELEHARLDQNGLHTPASDRIDEERERRRAAEAEGQRRLEAEALARARRAAEDSERARAHAEALASSHPAPSRIEHPAQPAARLTSPHDERWPSDLNTLRRLLGNEDLARRLEQPLSTDVECHVPAAVWHLMAVLEWRQRGKDAHPLAVRASIVLSGCGYSLTGEAVAGAIAIAKAHI
jgi:hypothetical protein